MYNVFKVVNWFRLKNVEELVSEDVNAEPLTQMKVMKLLYYAQATFLVKYGQGLFDSDILAWKFGPVVAEVHDKYRGRRIIVESISYEAYQDFSTLESDKRASQVLNAVYIAFGSYSASTLMKKTHTEMPWKSTSQGAKIEDDKMKEFYKETGLDTEISEKYDHVIMRKLYEENREAMDILKYK